MEYGNLLKNRQLHILKRGLSRVSRRKNKQLVNKKSIFAPLNGKRTEICPLFLYLTQMISKELISSLIIDKLSEDGKFLVEIKVSPANRIYVEIDSFDGVDIHYCATTSKFIESHLDREEADFEMEVSTSSISAPFKILNHYKKNLGSEVEVLANDNKKAIGILAEVNDEDFVLETSTMQKLEGKKKKQLVEETFTYKYEDVRSTKLVLKFK